MSRVIVVTSGKGGVGKSSVSVNLASALAFSKFKVCLIDGDFGLKNLDVMMGLENRVVYDLNDVVEGRCTIEQVLVKDKRMDSPAGVEKGFQYSASLANEAIVVVNLDVSSLRDADRVVGLLMKKGINTINMIINKVNVDDIEGARSLTVEDAQEILSLPLLGIVYDSHDMIEANNRGVPIFLNNQHLLHSCFVNISKRILGQQVPYAKYKKKSLIRRFFYS